MIAKRDQALEATTQDNNCNKQQTHQCLRFVGEVKKTLTFKLSVF